MPYTYTTLTATQRKEIALKQVDQFERELFGHELNRARLVDQKLPTTEPDAAIKTIELAIKTTVAVAGKL